MLEQDTTIYQNGGGIYDFDNNIMMNYYPKRIVELAGKNRRSCLELGIGYGITTEFYSKQYETYTVLEGDRKIICQYREMHPDSKAKITETYFEDWESDETFDVIVLGFILEHVDNPGEILKKYAGFLSPQGKMYITVPNAEALNRRVGKEAGILSDILQLSETDIRFGHKRYYTLESLRQEITAEDVGLNITKEEGIFLKPLTTAQMISLNLTENIVKGFLRVGREYPELCLGLLMETERV